MTESDASDQSVVNAATHSERHGWFSAKMKELADCGTSFYQTLDGGEVEVTAISSSRHDSGLGWDDTVYVGPVTKWLRKGKPASGRLVSPFVFR